MVTVISATADSPLSTLKLFYLYYFTYCAWNPTLSLSTSSARPGRPPKRSPSLHASPETIDKLKKTRFDGADFYNASRYFGKETYNYICNRKWKCWYLIMLWWCYIDKTKPENLVSGLFQCLDAVAGLIRLTQSLGRRSTIWDHGLAPGWQSSAQ